MANDEGKGKKAEELASAMKEAKSASADVTRSFQQQLDIIKQMRDAMNEVTKSMRMMCEQDCGGMSSDKWEEVAKAVDKTGNSTNNTTESVKKMADVMQSKWTKAALVSAAALDGLVQGFKSFIALSKGAFGVFSGLVGGLGSVAASIIAIPFKLISGLFSMAQKGGGGNELAAAYEEVRKEFGSFKSDSAKAIIDTAVNMDKMNQTGVSAYRIFGNAAERLKAVKEMAVGMGSAFQVFGPEVEKNGTAIMMYNKGLGITNEQLSSIASNAMRMGKGIADVQLDMTKQALGMSKAFGVNAKVISKDMAKAMQDLSHFGHLSTKELAVAATFANKLGVSVDKLTGIMDATATFDQAAEGMSKLNEQFGTNIDATAIMSAQNPAEKMEILRKEFAKTGKDMSQMTYQERMLIKQSSGLSDEMLNAAFSAKNAGVSLDKIASQGGKNEKKTMTQADAMHKLADSIERLTPSGGGAGGGLLNHLFQGFLRGIQTSPEFIKLMMNINRVLLNATLAGVEMGKKFVQVFPGIRKIFSGLADLFDPARFQKFFNSITTAFDKFSRSGGKGVKNFLDDITGSFKDFFGASQGARSSIVSGFKDLGIALLGILSKLGTLIVDQLVKVLPKVTEFVHNFFEYLKNPKKSGLKLSGSMPEWLEPVITLFEKLKTELLPALKPLVREIFIGLTPYLWGAFKTMLLVSFGSAAIKTTVTTISASLFGILSKGFLHSVGAIGDDALKKAGPLAEKLSGVFENIFGKVGSFAKSNMGKMLGKVAIVTAIADAAINISSAMREFGPKLQEEGFDPATADIAAGATGIINTLTFGLIPKGFQEKIASAIAEIADTLFKNMNDWFGPGFGEAFKKYYSGLFNVFGGLGDLLVSMWNGDSKGVNDALIKIGKGLMDMLLGAFEISMNALIKIGPRILEYLNKAMSFVSSKIGDIFLSLKDIPLVGFFFETIGNAFKDLSKLFDFFASMWSKVADVLKSTDITKIISDTLYNSLILPFKTAYDFISSTSKKLYDLLVTPLTNAWQWVKKIFGKEPFIELGTNIVEGFLSPIKNLAELVSHPFKSVITKLKEIFKTRSPSEVTEKIGEDVAAGFNNSLQAIPKNAEKVFNKTVDASKSLQDVKMTIPNASGSAATSNVPRINQQDLEVSTKIIKMITDLIDAISSAIGGKKPTGEINSASINAITSAVPSIMQLVNGIKEQAGPLVTAIVDTIKKVPTDANFKGTLDVSMKLFEFLAKIPELASKLGVVKTTAGESPIDGIMKSIGTVKVFLDRLLSDYGKNPLQEIINGVSAIGKTLTPDVSKTTLAIAKNITDLFTSFGNLGEAATKIPGLGTKIWAVSDEIKNNLAFQLSSLPDSIGQISSSMKKFSSIPLADMQSSLQIIQGVVKTLQQLDDSLSKLPKIDLQARLTEVAKGTGLGSSGIYTVKSKEVIINIELNVSMEADKVEQVIISRHNSIIRDRINYAIEKGGRGDEQAPSAKIKSTGPQTGFPGKQFGT